MFMEKTTKKRKTKKGLRKRIGIIAIGGMSVVLTVCLSVGATLAWFAGSTWASKNLYMGGPVYVEMAGRGTSGNTDGEPGQDGKPTKAVWQGGDGNLDIQAAAIRTTGTAELEIDENDDDKPDINLNDVLLPGQKVEIYSQARVFSTAETTTVADDFIPNQSSGANTTNTSNGTVTYRNEKGRVTTTTTSVLRARFSLEVEFDPGMGFNNFTANSTNEKYVSGYPVQSSDYTGDGTTGAWTAALDASFTTTNNAGGQGVTNPTITYTGRRDGVAQPTKAQPSDPDPVLWTADQTTNSELIAIRKGTKRSIYKWKYVSAAEYAKASDTLTPNAYGSKMAAPFAGTPIDTADAPTGYYGVWVSEVVDPTAQTKTYKLSEADAFYKARCNAYLGTYVEYYVNEYGNTVKRTVASSVAALEANLNSQFVKLVNDSSDAIIDSGMKNTIPVSTTGANPTTTNTDVYASWLYVDPLIGNDTNTDEISTSVGGWWYLVAGNDGAVGSKGNGANTIVRAVDSIGTSAAKDANDDDVNTITNTMVITRNNAVKDTDATDTTNDKYSRLDARLFEIIPKNPVDGTNYVSMNGTTGVQKIVSEALPFVNGTFALPSDALTNLFANAKITLKVSFQALQAFFPYTNSIDKITYTNPLLGTEKALSIRNAIPIYNEAFDYQETAGGTISGL